MIIEKIYFFVIQIVVLLFSVSIHESAHAWMAERFGDPTGRYQGRISLNPVVHLDPVGSIILPVMLAISGMPVFGWAKPVMVNPINLRNPRKDHMFIAAAGPISNLIAACVSIVLYILLRKIDILYPPIASILLYLIIINVFLAIFNLLPIPPLDGGWILEGALEGDALHQFQKFKQFGWIVLILIIMSPILGYIARPILNLIFKILSLS